MALRAPFGYADRAAEQSAHGSLVQARTRLCLIFNLPADALCAVPCDNVNVNALLITPMLLCGEAVALWHFVPRSAAPTAPRSNRRMARSCKHGLAHA